MNLEEANARLKNKISEEQLWGLNSLYILLDLHKDDFCKIVEVVGLETLLKKQRHYDRLCRAEENLKAREIYLNSMARLTEIEQEKAALEQIINAYNSI